MRSFKLPICALLLVAAGACNRTTQQAAAERKKPRRRISFTASMPTTTAPKRARWAAAKRWEKILNGYGVSALTVDRLDKASKEIFPLRNIRAGHKYTVFIHEDSLYAPHLDYLVYERNMSQYVVFGFHEDSVSIQTGEKGVLGAPHQEERHDQFVAVGCDHGGAPALCAGRGNGGHLPVDGRFLRHPEG